MTRYITYAFSVYIFKYVYTYIWCQIWLSSVLFYTLYRLYACVCACLIAHWFVSCFNIIHLQDTTNMFFLGWQANPSSFNCKNCRSIPIICWIFPKISNIGSIGGWWVMIHVWSTLGLCSKCDFKTTCVGVSGACKYFASVADMKKKCQVKDTSSLGGRLLCQLSGLWMEEPLFWG